MQSCNFQARPFKGLTSEEIKNNFETSIKDNIKNDSNGKDYYLSAPLTLLDDVKITYEKKYLVKIKGKLVLCDTDLEALKIVSNDKNFSMYKCYVCGYQGSNAKDIFAHTKKMHGKKGYITFYIIWTAQTFRYPIGSLSTTEILQCNNFLFNSIEIWDVNNQERVGMYSENCPRYPDYNGENWEEVSQHLINRVGNNTETSVEIDDDNNLVRVFNSLEPENYQINDWSNSLDTINVRSGVTTSILCETGLKDGMVRCHSVTPARMEACGVIDNKLYRRPSGMDLMEEVKPLQFERKFKPMAKPMEKPMVKPMKKPMANLETKPVLNSSVKVEAKPIAKVDEKPVVKKSRNRNVKKS